VEAIENVCVSEIVNVEAPVPAKVPGAFIVDLLEETGMMDRGEAELLFTWFEWVEVEVRGFPGALAALGMAIAVAISVFSIRRGSR